MSKISPHDLFKKMESFCFAQVGSTFNLVMESILRVIRGGCSEGSSFKAEDRVLGRKKEAGAVEGVADKVWGWKHVVQS